MVSEYKFEKTTVNEDYLPTTITLFKEDKNCDGSCVSVNTCPIINDKCK